MVCWQRLRTRQRRGWYQAAPARRRCHSIRTRAQPARRSNSSRSTGIQITRTEVDGSHERLQDNRQRRRLQRRRQRGRQKTGRQACNMMMNIGVRLVLMVRNCCLCGNGSLVECGCCAAAGQSAFLGFSAPAPAAAAKGAAFVERRSGLRVRSLSKHDVCDYRQPLVATVPQCAIRWRTRLHKKMNPDSCRSRTQSTPVWSCKSASTM